MKSLALAAAITICAALAPAQTTHREPGQSWQFTFPAGWEPSQELLSERNDFLRAHGAPAEVIFTTAAVKGDYDAFMLVQQTLRALPPGMTFDQLQESFTKGVAEGAKKANQSLKDVATDTSFSGVSVDRQRARVLSHADLTLTSGQQVRGLLVTHVLMDRIVQLNFYAPAETFQQLQPEFMQIADTLTIDPGAEYVFGARALNWSRVLLIGAVGGALGGGSALLRKLRKS